MALLRIGHLIDQEINIRSDDSPLVHFPEHTTVAVCGVNSRNNLRKVTIATRGNLQDHNKVLLILHYIRIQTCRVIGEIPFSSF